MANALAEIASMPFDKHVEFILGRTAFFCGDTARTLRLGGHQIPRHAENEQAYVIYWLLGLYLAHGENYVVNADALLNGYMAEYCEKVEAAKNGKARKRD